MKFKTLRSSETGKKFAEMEKEKDKAFEEAKVFIEKVGASQWAGFPNSAFGGISCLIFEKGHTVDKKIYKKTYCGRGYFPKKNTKEGKRLYNEIMDMTHVTANELNSCAGYEGSIFKTIGYDGSNSEYVLFELNDDWDYTIPADCVEITSSEYKELGSKKK